MAKTQKIKPNQDFLHGEKRYKEGRPYDVDPQLADYFKTAGWVDSDGSHTPTQAVDLDVHAAGMGQNAEV